MEYLEYLLYIVAYFLLAELITTDIKNKIKIFNKNKLIETLFNLFGIVFMLIFVFPINLIGMIYLKLLEFNYTYENNVITFNNREKIFKEFMKNIKEKQDGNTSKSKEEEGK